MQYGRRVPTMTLRVPSAELGRAEPWLRGVALSIWLFVGVSQSLGARPGIWLVPWSVYGAACFAGGFHRRLPWAVSLFCLAAQTLAVIGMARAGLSGSEGLLLAIVAAQAPTLFPFALAVGWALAQLAPLWAMVHASKDFHALMEIFGAYSTFSAFSLLLYWLHRSEVRTRHHLARVNGHLLTTRAAAIESTIAHERLRISRELHDSLGHALTALRIQLELAAQLASGEPLEPLGRARDLARDAIGEVRSAVGTMSACSRSIWQARCKRSPREFPLRPFTSRCQRALQTSTPRASTICFAARRKRLPTP
jgi:signal transduction histidine kinase